ncbi:MAG: hypothetical protein ACRD15_14805, partial [Vicinamibacterales bacterium]
VDITDMSAVGASPIYYDFDMIQEMQVVTGGADASQQTGGVGINFVTRSGTDRLRGSGRLYNTHERFQSENITDETRDQGAGSGNPIQNIDDEQQIQLPEHLGGKGAQCARRIRHTADRDGVPPEGRRRRVRQVWLADRPLSDPEGSASSTCSAIGSLRKSSMATSATT